MKRRLAEMWVLIASEKRKAMILGALAIVAGGLWLRAALTAPEKNGPAPTKAAAGAAAPAPPKRQRAAPSESADEPVPRVVVAIPPPPPLKRDLFKPDPVRYPRPSQTESTTAIDPKPAAGSADIPPVDAEALREAARREVRAEASRLRLRSTMIGSVPIAVIETDERGAQRAVLRPGDLYQGFRLVEVSARSAIFEKNGVRVELTISLP